METWDPSHQRFGYVAIKIVAAVSSDADNVVVVVGGGGCCYPRNGLDYLVDKDNFAAAAGFFV